MTSIAKNQAAVALGRLARGKSKSIPRLNATGDGNGALRILDGHPDGEWRSVEKAINYLSEINDHLVRKGLTAKSLKRCEGAYFFY